MTGFFRDPEAFEFIRRTSFPYLSNGAKRMAARSIWSAGCATGEEAIRWRAACGSPWAVIFPSGMLRSLLPISAGMQSVLRAAVYIRRTYCSDLPDGLSERFFERVEQGFHLKALRQTVIFGQQDISRGVPFPANRPGDLPQSADLSEARAATGGARSLRLFTAPVSRLSLSWAKPKPLDRPSQRLN